MTLRSRGLHPGYFISPLRGEEKMTQAAKRSRNSSSARPAQEGVASFSSVLRAEAHQLPLKAMRSTLVAHRLL